MEVAASQPAAAEAPAANGSEEAPQQNMATAASDSMAAATSMNVLETYLQNFNQELQTPGAPGATPVAAGAAPVAVVPKQEDRDQAAEDSAEEEGALTVVENQDVAPPTAVPVAVTDGRY